MLLKPLHLKQKKGEIFSKSRPFVIFKSFLLKSLTVPDTIPINSKHQNFAAIWEVNQSKFCRF